MAGQLGQPAAAWDAFREGHFACWAEWLPPARFDF
jgi:hypothetical protein